MYTTAPLMVQELWWKSIMCQRDTWIIQGNPHFTSQRENACCANMIPVYLRLNINQFWWKSSFRMLRFEMLLVGFRIWHQCLQQIFLVLDFSDYIFELAKNLKVGIICLQKE